MKNFFFVFTLLTLGIAGLFQALSRNSDCFSSDFVYCKNYPSSPPIDASSPQSFLEKPFYFLGSGHQSFAFESEDHQHVLKLIKFHQITTEEKMHQLMKALTIAGMLNRKSAGIEYIHFSGTPISIKTLQVFDKGGRIHHLDATKLLFVIQKKATPLHVILRHTFLEGNVPLAKEKIGQLFKMFNHDLKMGIYDRDHNILHNTGFQNLEPIRIDYGKLSIDNRYTSLSYRQIELKKLANERILSWMNRYFPQFREEIEVFLHHLINEELRSEL